MKGPFPLSQVKVCPACLDWIEPGEDVFLLEEGWGPYTLDDYIHVGCVAAWEAHQQEEDAPC